MNMIAKTVTFFFVLSVALAANDKPFADVDPNTLSCDPEGQVFLLLPHFTDCTKFFMCTHGKEVPFTCSGGLIFDFELQGCNWESDATCILRTPQEDNSGDGDEGSGDEVEWIPEGEGSGEGSGDWEDKIEWAPVRPIPQLEDVEELDSHHFGQSVIDCKNVHKAALQVPYKGDCQRYWHCQDGLPHVKYCNDGYFFNEKTQQCDLEANVNCQVELEDELHGEYMLQ